jgi:hypothetical protein
MKNSSVFPVPEIRVFHNNIALLNEWNAARTGYYFCRFWTPNPQSSFNVPKGITPENGLRA